ncbi:MAG: SMP-30/gluconolactonase/LRE family protein [Allosphingosinicella sp.]
MKRLALLLALATLPGGCMSAHPPAPAYALIGTVHREGAALDALVAPDAVIEKLGEGYRWSEGPVWIENGDYLLFSDVPANRMYRWSERDGVTLFLEPSGYSGPNPEAFREGGSNGLIRGPGNTILVADHGNRAVVRIDLATKERTFLARQYQGKTFNSPNDLVLAKSGAIYFTDPPYGLEGLNESPLKELPHNGVYRLDPDGTVTLLHAGFTFPNGIILSPDERTLYVANSDPERAVIVAFDLGADGSLSNERLFADMTPLVGKDMPGLPDGMAVDQAGNLFATGPGGVHVFAPDGTRLGRIDSGTAIANAAFGEDGRTLFLASNDRLARIRTRTKGVGF